MKALRALKIVLKDTLMTSEKTYLIDAYSDSSFPWETGICKKSVDIYTMDQ